MNFDLPTHLVAYLKELDAFIESSRIEPGTLEHLYPEVVGDSRS